MLDDAKGPAKQALRTRGEIGDIECFEPEAGA